MLSFSQSYKTFHIHSIVKVFWFSIEPCPQLLWSPDGQTLAINSGPPLTAYDGEIWFFKPATNQLIMGFLSNLIGASEMKWSMDSQWVVSNYAGVLVLYRSPSFLPMVLAESGGGVFDWSKNDSLLVYSQISDRGSILFLSDPETLNATQLIQYPSAHFSNPIWANHSSDIAIRVRQSESLDLLVVNAETKELKSLLSLEDIDIYLEPLAWSPDDQWLLFSMLQIDKQGLYVINPTSGVFYQVLDTMHHTFPTKVYWLSDGTNIPSHTHSID